MDALARKAIPGPDEKLKRIVGGQIASLLKGGYPTELVRHHVVELGLGWDNAKGHQRLLGLRRAVLQDVADRELAAHQARKRLAEAVPIDPAVARAILNASRRALRGERPIQSWSVRCDEGDCERTALYATSRCAEHTAVRELGVRQPQVLAGGQG